jgi:hypothetical protein
VLVVPTVAAVTSVVEVVDVEVVEVEVVEVEVVEVEVVDVEVDVDVVGAVHSPKALTVFEAEARSFDPAHVTPIVSGYEPGL